MDKHSAVKQVHYIWTQADCPPRTQNTMKKLFDQLVMDRKVLIKNKKSKSRNENNELRRFDDAVWDVLAEEQHRLGLTFDIKFFEEQKLTWKSQMEKTINPEFEKEVEEKDDTKKKKEKRIGSQYENFDLASTKDVDLAIHQVSFVTET